LQNIVQKKHKSDVFLLVSLSYVPNKPAEAHMIIPYQELSVDALQALIEEFVTRSGTDYGASEASLDDKVQHVKRQLEKGEAVIVYDQALESCNITSAQQARALFPTDSE
jgi:hypothetical protein